MLKQSFAKDEKVKDKKVSKYDTAWSNDVGIYRSKDFPQYNPDDLIGRKGYSIYQKMMVDEQVKAVVKFKRDAITSRDFTFIFEEEAKEILSNEEQDKRISVFKGIIDNYEGSFLDAINGIATSIKNGFSITEKVFDVININSTPWIGVKKLELKPFHTFYFYEDNYGNLLRFTQEVGGKQIDLDINNFIHFVNNPDINKYYGQSELREAYRSWFSKDIVIKFWNIFLQRYASGFIWAEVQEGFTIDPDSDEYRSLQNVLQNIQVSTGIIAPQGVKINVEIPVTTDAFEKAIDKHDRGIAKSLLIPNLLGITEQGGVGSYSQSKTQLEAFFWTLESDAARLCEVINEQLFKHLGNINFGDGIYPKFKFKPISLQVAMEIVNTWQKLVSGNAVTTTETDEEHIRDILGFPAADKSNSGIVNPKKDTGQQSPIDQSNIDPKVDDETIIGGKGTARITALSRASNRVDFIAIDTKVDVITHTQTNVLEQAMDSLINNTLDKIPDELDPKIVAKIVPNSGDIKNIQKIISNTLKSGWKVGETQANIEIKKAERQAKKEFSKSINFARLGDNANKFFDAKSFIIAGDLSQQVINIMKQEIMNGIQYSKSIKEVRETILKRLSSSGLISDESLISAGIDLGLANPKHRLDTVIRTASFMAINEGRLNYHTDPALDNFVRAFEYSSVLDSRTTTICNELGGAATGKPHVHSTDWPGWDKFRPPNHYNCRAILIPITEIDDWAESEQPTVEPQEGFG